MTCRYPRFGVLLTLVLGCNPAFAADLAGKWDFVWQTPGGERRSSLIMEAAGENVTARMGPEVKATITGTFKEGRLALAGPMYSAEAGQEGAFKLDGRMDGGVLKGTASWNEHAMTFTARRATVAGKWNFVWQTQGGDRNSTLEITVEGENVSAKMGPESGTGTLAGSFRDGRLQLTGPVTSPRGTGTLKLDGNLTGDELKGRAVWNEYDIAFSARRAD